MKTIRNDELLRIDVDVEQSLVISTWKATPSSEVYRTALWQMLEAVKDSNLALWLSDTRGLGLILRADENWSMEVFVPELMKEGLRRVAVVQGAEYFNRTVTERLVDATSAVAAFKVELFGDAEEAEGWLAKELEALV